jgi:SAM-dependent methyltransferase
MQSAWSKAIGGVVFPGAAREWIRRQRIRLRWPVVGFVRFGNLRRVRPISKVFGLDRGARERCIDIYYIERFLLEHAGDISGRVLEVGDNAYTRKFGGARVVQSDVLHARADNPNATIVTDLTVGDQIPSDAFDCIICTQTLQFIYDVHAAVRTLYRILRPGGVLLATFTGISQISRYDMDRWGDYWRFTTKSAERLIGECWPSNGLSVETHGNVLLCVAYLHGLTIHELKTEELEYRDPDYPLVITVRAVKPSGLVGDSR